MTVYSTREHSNPEYTGFCCPHCLQSAEYTSESDDNYEADKVTCKKCGKEFAIWTETETINVSGFIEEGE
ncbi:MAG: hypothetical protein GY928_10190 [Colwellia sp.]|nr:hypothetical protein [Colwellia sp.]